MADIVATFKKCLNDWGYDVTRNDKEHCDTIYKQLSRWVNDRFVFAKCERFENYTQKKTETENDPTLWD